MTKVRRVKCPTENTQCQLILPLQLKFANKDRIASFRPRLAQSILNTQGLQNALKSAHRLIVFPVRHSSRSLARFSGNPPAFWLALNTELARVTCHTVDRHGCNLAWMGNLVEQLRRPIEQLAHI